MINFEKCQIYMISKEKSTLNIRSPHHISIKLIL